MSCTLEQCNILHREYNLTRQEFRRIIDCMRRYIHTSIIEYNFVDIFFINVNYAELFQ